MLNIFASEMKNSLHISKCNLCNRPDVKLLFEDIRKFDRSYNVYQCPHCDTAVTVPFPDKEELNRLYSSDNYRAHDRRFIYPVELFVKHFNSSRLRSIERICKKGRMLDIGCGRGLALHMAREKGWETFGLEFSDDSAFHAKNILDLDVRTGGLPEAGFEHNSFDVITIWQVLEHMEKPEQTLRECYRLLKTGGVLVMSVPNRESLQARFSGRHWFHLDVPYHLYHFSAEGIKGLLERLSFRVGRTTHFSFEQNVFGFIQSLLNICGISNNFLYDILKTRGLRTHAKDMRYVKDLLLTLLLLPVNVPLSLLLAVIEAVLGRGGTVEVYAVK